MKSVSVLAFITAIALTGVQLVPHSPNAEQVKAERALKDDADVSHSQQSSSSGFTGGCTGFEPVSASSPVAAEDDLQALGASALANFLGPKKSKVPSGIQYAIALAPDPLHTNLSLLFDREMSAIQQAAQDDGFLYDSSWMPWRVRTTTSSSGTNRPKASQVRARQACPGILLFRRNASASDQSYDGLIVFVVGEQPTGGVNQDQWNNAIHWLALHAAERPANEKPAFPLRVIGPSFSGSLPSLKRDLDGLYGDDSPGTPDAAHFKVRFPAVRILSGSIRSCSSIQLFRRTLKPNVLFDTFQENDAVLINRFLRYLKNQNTDGKDVAVISEDETAYASPPSANASTPDPSNLCDFKYGSESRPLRLSYPRDISALRTAYDKQSIFSTSSSAQHTVRRILQQSDDDLPDASTNDGDTIPTFSGDVTPVAEEAVLYGIVSYLRTHHTRYLLLRCSNQLDFLFLTRFFHQAYPEGRIVTVGSDLLFRREIDSTEFRGVMALSTYPLLPRNSHWSALFDQSSELLPNHTHRVFEDHNQEGEYIAARYIFGSGDGLMDREALPFQADIPDSAEPFWFSKSIYPGSVTHAPTWISVVGRDGYWPVAVMDESSTPKVNVGVGDSVEQAGSGPEIPQQTLVKIKTDQKHYEREPSHPDRPNHTLYFGPALSWRAVTLSAFCLLIYQIIAVVWGTEFAGHRLLWPFRRVSSTSQALLLGLNCAFAAMLVLAPLSIFRISPGLMVHDTGAVAISALAVAGIVALLYCVFRFNSRVGIVFLGAVLLALAGISLASLHGSLNDANRVPLTIRITQLTSGASPLLPVLFLFVGFYLWSWHSMAGNSLLCCGRPVLPKFLQPGVKTGSPPASPKERLSSSEKEDACLHGAHYRISEEIGDRIVFAASPFTLPPPVSIPCASLLLIILLCYHRDLPLLTIESHVFAFWVNIGVLAACLITSAEAARLFTTWSELKILLVSLDQTRLRRTFARLRAVDAQSLWSVSGNVSRVQSHFLYEQLDAASRLLRLSNVSYPSLTAAALCGRRFVQDNAACIHTGLRWEKSMSLIGSPGQITIRELFSDAVAEVLNQILIPAWKAERASLNLGGTTESAPSSDGITMALSEDEAVRTAEEFVCFHYIAFIQNVMARMRSMALSMATLFVAVCLAISFYPFVPRTEIGLWMLANLVVIGGSVLYVYAAMERDSTLSHIASSQPGQLGSAFWVKSAGFLTAPILAILTTQFPSIADSVLGWVQPGLDAISR